MSRTVKLWIATALALIVYAVLTWLLAASLARRGVLSGDAADTMRRTLWTIGALAAAAVLWFRRPAPTPKRPPDDLETLLAAADRTLAQSATGAGGRHRASLATLPTVVVLGPDASVKTTTVMRSGLEPDLLAGAAQQDGVVAPTAAVNVWYARGTLFVEAGPPVLAAPERWTRLVRLLQPDRREAVLGRGTAAARAALVCFSCEELLRGGGSDAVEATARTLRARLAELSQQLGVPLPVYVLFTKLDRVSFFAEFVQHFSREESVDVLGATLMPADGGEAGLYEQRATPRIEAAFSRLFGALVDRRTMVLRREHAEERRWDAYEFPREFRKLAAPATRFLLELCRPSQLGVSPFLRGFYFSGVQAVVVHDVAPAAVRPAAARHSAVAAATDATGAFRALDGATITDRAAVPPTLKPPRRVPRWMFLGRLFEDVLLADGVARRMTGGGERVELARRALAATAAAAAGLAAFAFTISWWNNDDLLDEAAAAARGVTASAAAPAVPNAATLRALDTLRGAVARLEAHAADGAPLWVTFGLYRGGEVRDALWHAYFRALDRQGFGRARQDVVRRLRTLADTAAGDRYTPTYELLKAHLMMTSGRRHADSAWLVPVLARAWSVGDGAVDSLLARQLAFYAASLASARRANPYDSLPDAEGVDSARAYLTRFVGSAPIYGALVSHAPDGLPDVSLRREYPQTAAAVRNDYVVPAAFTARGWGKVQAALKNDLERYAKTDEWVLAVPATALPDVRALRDTLGTRYRREYVERWTTFLRQTQLLDPRGHLPALTSNASPVFQALKLASRNTDVPDAAVTRAFAPLHAVSPPADTLGMATKDAGAYLAAMQQFSAAVDKLDAATPGNRLAIAEEVQAASGQAEGAAIALANAAPADPDSYQVQAAVRDLLVRPTVWAKHLAPEAVTADLGAAGRSVCEAFRPLEGRYPLDPTSPRDAAPSDVVDVLHPENGKLWAHVNQLSAFVTRQGSRWVAARDGPPVSADFLEFLSRAARLTAALFPENAAQPQVALTFDRVEPKIPAGAVRVVVQIGDRPHYFDDRAREPGSFGAVRMSTPQGEARVGVEYRSRADSLVVARFTGPWAPLRLLQSATSWRDHTNGSYLATWSVNDARRGPVSVTIVVKTSEAAVALRQGAGAVRCRSPLR